jgi:hypothetical protein
MMHWLKLISPCLRYQNLNAEVVLLVRYRYYIYWMISRALLRDISYGLVILFCNNLV